MSGVQQSLFAPVASSSREHAPVLDRHMQAARRALVPLDGAAVHMDLTVESDSARHRATAAAQSFADFEFEILVREMAFMVAWGLPGGARQVAGVSLEDYRAWYSEGKDGDVRDLVLRGWK